MAVGSTTFATRANLPRRSKNPEPPYEYRARRGCCDCRDVQHQTGFESGIRTKH